jgi:dodecin
MPAATGRAAGSGARCVPGLPSAAREEPMPGSVYKVIEVIGTSAKSWEDAATTAIDKATKSLRDLRIAEVIAQDMVIDDGKVTAFRTKLKLSFKYED